MQFVMIHCISWQWKFFKKK